MDERKEKGVKRTDLRRVVGSIPPLAEEERCVGSCQRSFAFCSPCVGVSLAALKRSRAGYEQGHTEEEEEGDVKVELGRRGTRMGNRVPSGEREEMTEAFLTFGGG